MGFSVAFATILFKEVHRFLRIWPQTLLPPVVTTSLYFLIFGRIIGSKVGGMAGHGYLEYIVPGVILMSVITNAYGNVVASFYSTKFQRHVEELLIAPVPNWVILAGYVGGGIARGLAVGLAVAGIAAVHAPIRIEHPGVVAVVFLMTATLFSLAGFLNALFANSFDDISIVPNFVLTPLVYLGGVFYSIEMLPEPWRSISLGNPILYMINAFRFGFLGTTDVELWQATTMISCLIVLLWGVSIWLLARGVGLKS